jgi:hypothetical protein
VILHTRVVIGHKYVRGGCIIVAEAVIEPLDADPLGSALHLQSRRYPQGTGPNPMSYVNRPSLCA